jgi:hypothetical protein
MTATRNDQRVPDKTGDTEMTTMKCWNVVLIRVSGRGRAVNEPVEAATPEAAVALALLNNPGWRTVVNHAEEV